MQNKLQSTSYHFEDLDLIVNKLQIQRLCPFNGLYQ